MSNIKKQFIHGALLTLTLSFPFNALAQEANDKLSKALHSKLTTTKANETITLFIYFKDKGDNIEEKLLQAKASLTPGSLQRRIINLGPENVVSHRDIPVNPDYLTLIKTQVAKVRHPLKALNAVSVEATPEAIANISKYDFVQRIEQVKQLTRSSAPQVENALQKSAQTDQTKDTNTSQALDYGTSFTQNDQINVPAVHELGYNGSGIVIAVFDSGFDRLTHEAFDQIDIQKTWDFVNDDEDVGNVGEADTSSHGTKTLSTIGGFSSGNLIGPAYGATYILARTENNQSELHVEEDNWCAAAEWAETNGARIITSSLGYTGFDSGIDYTPDDLDGNTTIITKCADLAAQAGIVVINSVGNAGPNEGENTLGAPSDGNFVLGVGAVQSDGTRSSFSSEGPTADGRIKPEVVAMGSSVTVASSSSDNEYSGASGTSFSCPLTSGVAALVLQANNNLTAAQVRDIIRNSADQTSTPDNSLGHGIINSLAAVEEALATTTGSIAPNASFAVLTDGRTASLTSTSTDSDGTIDTFAWNLGDGNSSSDESLSHTYSAVGSYTITLTVTDNDGLTESVSRNITVTGSATPDTPSSSGGGGSNNYGFILLIGLFVIARKKLLSICH